MSVFSPAYWFMRRAALHPQREAILYEGRRITYGELWSRSSKLAAALLARGLGRGARVAMLSKNRPEYVELITAASALGAIVVPLNYRLAAPELRQQLKDSGARALFYEQEFGPLAGEVMEGLELAAVLDATEGGGLASRLDPSSAELARLEELAWDEPLLICYTSGTTGPPKGAIITHWNMFWNAVNDILGLDLNSNDVTLTLLPMYHTGGINLFTFPTLLAGGRVVLVPKFEPREVLRLIAQERVTVVFGVPTIFKVLLECEDFTHTDLSSVRMFYSGGAPCPPELIRAYQEKGLPFGQGYGLTETSPTAFLIDMRDSVRKRGSVGKPALFCEAKVVDEDGRELGPYQLGEVLIAGPDVFSGYWNRPQETASTLKDGWLHTGDVGFYDEEGFWYIVDRKKDVIITGGEKVYPGEVESVLLEHPKVADAAVIAVPDPKWGEVPKALVVPKPGQTPTLEELRTFCGARLARYKLPKYLALLEQIPRTPTGKVLRRELRARHGEPRDELKD